MRLAMISGFCLAAALISPACADGLVYRLPPDGAQIRYDMELMISAGDQQVPIKGFVTVSSVGQATVDNEKCRWIEIKFAVNADAQEHMQLMKTLVRESDVGKGKSPLEHVVRTWVRNENAEVIEVKDLKSNEAVTLNTFLAGAPKNSGELEKIEIDGKLGKLECAGVTGEFEVEGPNGMTIVINFENRLHEKAPFGLVTANWKFELKNNGQSVLTGTFKLTPAETNTTALSELPDKN